MSIRDVKQIKIMIETNVSKTPEALELSQIFNPFASGSDKENSETETETETEKSKKKKNDIKKYPYFIESIPYPEEVLNTKSYSNILKIFFDKNVFYKTIVEPYVNLKTAEPDVKIIEKNIMIMLNLIFPTSYPSSNNINTSYNKYLLKTPYELKFDLGELTSGISIPGFTNNSKAEYSYLKKNGTTYTVTEILWLNDILNEPEYKKLIDELIEYNTWVDDTKFEASAEQSELIATFVKGIQYNESDDKNSTGKESNAKKTTPGEKTVKSLRINDREIYLIERQKKMFSSTDLNTEIDNIWNYFITPSTVANELLNVIKISVDNKKTLDLTAFIKNILRLELNKNTSKTTSKTTSSIVSAVIKDIEFKHVKELDEKNMETQIDEINIVNRNKETEFKTAEETAEETVQETVQVIDKEKLFKILLHFLFKPYYKLKISTKISADNQRLYNENIKYDTIIDDLIKNIENLNKMSFNIEKEGEKDVDLSPETSLYKNITESINIIENIQKLFGKIEFYKSNEYTTLSNKINQLIALSTKIRKFMLVNQYVLQKEKGICVNYAELIENEEEKKILSEELKESKYARFNDIVSTINAFYTTRKSLNPDIQTFMDDYFNCKNSKFNDEVISNIEKLENNQKIDKNNFKKWNISVTLCSDETNTSNKYYEIFVYMDTIEGELNSSNTSSVSCSFLDEKLSEMFKKLTSSQSDNDYNVPRSDKIFNVSDIAKKKIPDEKAPTETPPEQPKMSSDKPPQQVETKTGGKHRESRKNKRNKKMRKTKRHRIRT